MSDKTLKCQYDRTDHPADFQIFDCSDSDPYTSVTLSCQTHIGELLSHALHVIHPIHEWKVFSV